MQMITPGFGNYKYHSVFTFFIQIKQSQMQRYTMQINTKVCNAEKIERRIKTDVFKK